MVKFRVLHGDLILGRGVIETVENTKGSARPGLRSITVIWYTSMTLKRKEGKSTLIFKF